MLPTEALALAVAAEWRWQVAHQHPECLFPILKSALCVSYVQESLALGLLTQTNNRLQPSTMPLMSLAATAIDQVSQHPHLPACLVS